MSAENKLNKTLEQVKVLHDKEAYPEAIELLNTLLKDNHKVAEVYFWRGILHDKLDKPSSSLEDYTQAIQLNPNEMRFFINQGIALSRLNRYQEAQASFDKAINQGKHSPNLKLAYHNRAFLKEKLQDWEGALKDYEKVTTLYDKAYEAFANQGIILIYLKKYNEAIDCLSHAIKIKPSFDFAYFKRGTAYMLIKENEKALTDFDTAIELNSKNNNYYFSRATLKAESLQKPSEAIVDFTTAIQIDPNDYQAFFNRATAYNSLQKHELSIKDFEQTLVLKPDFASAAFYLGTVYYNINKKRQACEAWQKAKALGLEEADIAIQKFCKKPKWKFWK